MSFLPLPLLTALVLALLGALVIRLLATVPCRGGCGRRVRSNDPLRYARCGLCANTPGWHQWR